MKYTDDDPELNELLKLLAENADKDGNFNIQMPFDVMQAYINILIMAREEFVKSEKLAKALKDEDNELRFDDAIQITDMIQKLLITSMSIGEPATATVN